MQLNRLLIIAVMACFGGSLAATAQKTLSLDSCRRMALGNNKELRAAEERINSASFQQKQARAAYLPSFDLQAMYLYNQKEISLLESDQYLPTKSFNPATGGYDYNLVMKPDGTPLFTPDGTPVPSQVAVIPKSAMTYDTHNVFAGAITLTQPLYMGGKIRALNKMADYGKEIASQLLDNARREVIYSVDAAYWQVVSLSEKKKLADSYICLLDTLHSNVAAMIREGIATPSDLLTVDVKLNDARIDLTKVDNGLVLSKMALAQLCGMPLDEKYVLVDELAEEKNFGSMAPLSFSMEQVFANRSDVKGLELGVKVYEQKQWEARSEMLPQLALMGAYSVTNPNVFNGFDKSFKGMFSVGAVLKMPLWHWGGNYNKYRVARSEKIVRELELEETKEKVELQVTQAAFRINEAQRTLNMTASNLDKADENLRQASLGYREGVMTLTTVMEAQTAWLKAYSENIDAQIDVALCNIYLRKVTGTLDY